MSSLANTTLMARYNRWMNQQLYLAAASIDSFVLVQDRGAFFKSVLGTLNHILVADIIWLQRFYRHPAEYSSLAPVAQLATPPTLDAILYPQFDRLQQYRAELDDVIMRWALQVSEADLAVDLVYVNTRGEQYCDNFGALVQHFYNHQTHHRGQVSTLLSQLGIELGSTDLLSVIRT